MKVVLFCGGQGTRIRAASESVPKPLLEVGEQPILLHLMRYYAHWGHTEFILCLGYKAHVFKQWFLNYNEALHTDFVLSESGRHVELLDRHMDRWKITFVDTGATTNVGGRLSRVREFLGDDEYFLANYGDQLSDAPLPAMVDRLQAENRVASAIAVKPTYSTHLLNVDDVGLVRGVKPMNDGSLRINGGFFVFRHDIFDYMRPEEDLVEEPFARLIAADQLIGYRYDGFWAPMDTLKDKTMLDALAESPRPPWAVWANGTNTSSLQAA